MALYTRGLKEEVGDMLDDMSETNVASRRTSACRSVAVTAVITAMVGAILMLYTGFPQESLKTMSAKDAIATASSTPALKYDRYTSPYYFHKGLCPEGEGIILKEDCNEAGNLFGLGNKISVDKERVDYNPGCRRESWGEKGVVFNPKFTGTKIIDGSTSICKKKPKDMTDFGALQENLQKMIFHCLEEAGESMGNFKACMMQVQSWDLNSKSWTEEDLKEQHEAVDKRAEEAAKAREKAEHSCWTTHTGKVAGRVGKFYPLLADAKMTCQRMGDKCTALSCKKITTFAQTIIDRCAIKGPGDDDIVDQPRSSVTYVVYTPCAEGEDKHEAEDERDCWTKHDNKYIGGYANGHSTKYDLAGAKEKCLELSKCKGVTCNPGLTSCTCRAGSGLGTSGTGEVSFKPNDC